MACAHDITDLATVTIRPWHRADITLVPLASSCARAAWLPAIGPSSWLLWHTFAAAIANADTATWATTEFARAHGIGVPVLDATLRRLTQFQLITPGYDDFWLVTPGAPPLWPSRLRRAPSQVKALHARTFPHHA